MNKTSSFFQKIKNFVIAHKIISVVGIVVVLFGGYKLVKAFGAGTTQTSYVISAVEKGTIVSAVSGSGQVSASNEVSVTSKVSGDLVSLNVKSGQEVVAGQLLAQIDSRSAAISLENARLSLQNLTDPNRLSLLQAQNSLESAKQAKINALDNLSSSYTSALGSVASAFVDFPGVIEGLNNMFYVSTGTLNDTDSASLSITARQYRDDAGANFDKAKNKYNETLALYKSINTLSSTSSIEDILDKTLETSQELMQAVKDTKNTIDYVKNLGKESTLKNIPTAQSNLNTWLGEMNGDVTSLSSAKSSIYSAKVSITDTDRSLKEKQTSLNDSQGDSSNIDVRSQQLAVQQQEQNYADYFIRAPFSGVVAKVSIENTNTVNSGTAIATIITKNKVADVSLNEVDISKIKVGQKATLTFDAVEGLTISGEVAEVDLVGTVSQGVVSYNVKIAFDTEDSRVLSGMSASATIATEVKQDVVIVPNGAVKSQGSTYYVETVDPSTPLSTGTQGDILSIAPEQKEVEVGISDDTSTEIISGLSEGDKIVTKTVTSTAAKTTTASAPSLFGGGGTRSFGGTQQRSVAR